LILILAAAAGISWFVGDLTDALAILAIILLNGVLGFIQEWRAERALDSLRTLLEPTCTVLREGRERDVPASTIVPGDIVLLETGNRTPADLRLVRGIDPRFDESSLTGESVSVSKKASPVSGNAPLAERSCMAWMGTTITEGRAVGVVVATGRQTQLGRIAQLTKQVKREPTTLQVKLAKLARQLGIASLGVASLTGGVGWLLGKPALEMFLTGVSLAVAVVPEGLPAVVTVTLALGVRNMVRRRALLRRLQAAETLGSATAICVDKTGTLTQNEMTVQEILLPDEIIQVTGVGYDPAGHFERNGVRLDYRNHERLNDLLTAGLICNRSTLEHESGGWKHRGEPTEVSLVVAAYKAWLSPDIRQRIVSEIPFSSSRKLMSVVTKSDDSYLACVKGAPEVVLAKCTSVMYADGERKLTDSERDSLLEANRGMARRGYRTLALARRRLALDSVNDASRVESGLVLLGFVGIADPPRPEVPDAVRAAQRAGIFLVMITGDSAETATSIAQMIGLSADRAVTGVEVDALDEVELRNVLSGPVLFARTTPEHKLRIVTTLQAMGHVVGMTGDGVNDAPALKKSDVGIAMGIRGTDVAKGVADMVITDDNFASIVGAVEEGRREYDNIEKFVRYLLSSNAGEVVAIFLNIVFGGPLILIPVQILWINLVTDGLTALALGVEPPEADVMDRPPRNPERTLLDIRSMAMIATLGGYIGVATLVLFQIYLPRSGGLAVAHTMAFTGIILMEKANVFNFRSDRTSLFRRGVLTNRWLLAAVGLSVMLQVFAIYTPFMQVVLGTTGLGIADWLAMLMFAAPVIAIGELWKWFSTARQTKRSH
jgi:Ca2+-transporting ATPase